MQDREEAELADLKQLVEVDVASGSSGRKRRNEIAETEGKILKRRKKLDDSKATETDNKQTLVLNDDYDRLPTPKPLPPVNSSIAYVSVSEKGARN